MRMPGFNCRNCGLRARPGLFVFHAELCEPCEVKKRVSDDEQSTVRRALFVMHAAAVKVVWMMGRKEGQMRRAGLLLKTRAIVVHDRLITKRTPK